MVSNVNIMWLLCKMKQKASFAKWKYRNDKYYIIKNTLNFKDRKMRLSPIQITCKFCISNFSKSATQLLKGPIFPES